MYDLFCYYIAVKKKMHAAFTFILLILVFQSMLSVWDYLQKKKKKHQNKTKNKQTNKKKQTNKNKQTKQNLWSLYIHTFEFKGSSLC